MTNCDIGEEISRTLQRTPLISMRPMLCEWRELIENCDSLSYVRSGKEELYYKMLQHIQLMNPDEQNLRVETHKEVAEDLLICMAEADISYL
jgi:hypothetical protein